MIKYSGSNRFGEPTNAKEYSDETGRFLDDYEKDRFGEWVKVEKKVKKRVFNTSNKIKFRIPENKNMVKLNKKMNSLASNIEKFDDGILNG